MRGVLYFCIWMFDVASIENNHASFLDCRFADSANPFLLSLSFFWATHLCLVKGARERERGRESGGERKGNKRGRKRAEAELASSVARSMVFAASPPPTTTTNPLFLLHPSYSSSILTGRDLTITIARWDTKKTQLTQLASVG